MRIGINAIYLIIYININAYGYNVFYHMNMDIFNEYVYIYMYTLYICILLEHCYYGMHGRFGYLNTCHI